MFLILEDLLNLYRLAYMTGGWR